MSVLVVDNGTTLLSSLLRALPNDATACHWNDVGGKSFEDFTHIILSGGSAFEVEGHENLLYDEMKLIRECTKPLLGICYGMEVMVKAWGGTLEKMPEDHRGIIDISVVQPDRLFGETERFSLYEHHQWRVRDLPVDFVVLASSVHGCEAIRHRFLPQYGLQFHPEKVAEGTLGRGILENFLKKGSGRESMLFV